MSRLAASPGNEIGSGKILSPESSAALAINCLGWYIDRPTSLPPFAGIDIGSPAVQVDIEFQARFPWSGGRHPWLDGVVMTSTHLVGIESKRFEPFRDQKTAAFSDAYDRDVWGEHMKPFTNLRDALLTRSLVYRWLDAAQLIKHGFGLVTEARRRELKPVLIYLYAEPHSLHGKPIVASSFDAHRAEIDDFASRIAGAEVQFASTSYRDWIADWPEDDVDVTAHGRRVLGAFKP